MKAATMKDPVNCYPGMTNTTTGKPVTIHQVGNCKCPTQRGKDTK